MRIKCMFCEKSIPSEDAENAFMLSCGCSFERMLTPTIRSGLHHGELKFLVLGHGVSVESPLSDHAVQVWRERVIEEYVRPNLRQRVEVERARLIEKHGDWRDLLRGALATHYAKLGDYTYAKTDAEMTAKTFRAGAKLAHLKEPAWPDRIMDGDRLSQPLTGDALLDRWRRLAEAKAPTMYILRSAIEKLGVGARQYRAMSLEDRACQCAENAPNHWVSILSDDAFTYLMLNGYYPTNIMLRPGSVWESKHSRRRIGYGKIGTTFTYFFTGVLEKKRIERSALGSPATFIQWILLTGAVEVVPKINTGQRWEPRTLKEFRSRLVTAIEEIDDKVDHVHFEIEGLAAGPSRSSAKDFYEWLAMTEATSEDVEYVPKHELSARQLEALLAGAGAISRDTTSIRQFLIQQASHTDCLARKPVTDALRALGVRPTTYCSWAADRRVDHIMRYLPRSVFEA